MAQLSWNESIKHMKDFNAGISKKRRALKPERERNSINCCINHTHVGKENLWLLISYYKTLKPKAVNPSERSKVCLMMKRKRLRNSRLISTSGNKFRRLLGERIKLISHWIAKNFNRNRLMDAKSLRYCEETYSIKQTLIRGSASRSPITHQALLLAKIS